MSLARRLVQHPCEGECTEHFGTARQVHVWHGAYDWGLFTYCDNAIELDRSRGFTVEEPASSLGAMGVEE